MNIKDKVINDADWGENCAASVPIAQLPGEILFALERTRWFFRTFAKRDINIVMELGSGEGGNLCLLGRLLSDNGFLISLTTPDPHWPMFDYGKVREIIKPVPLEVIPHRTDALEAEEKLIVLLDGRKIDVLFIDASHEYLDVKHDFYTFLPYMAQPSVVMLHDIATHAKSLAIVTKGESIDNIEDEPMCGASMVFHEIQASKRYPYESIALAPAIGYGIGIVYMLDPDWGTKTMGV